MKKSLALILSLSLLTCNLSLPVYAAATKAQDDSQSLENIIKISTADDLIELSKNANVEIFSLGKTFVLENDIDLSNADFTPIAIFSGTLDGAGFTIKGLNINTKSSDAALIGVLGDKGVVKNLSVEGSINPSGSKSTVGGIAGLNKGIISDTSFAGVVKAYEEVGGIAGINDENGFIINSKNYASVDASKKLGGIAGENRGTIVSSINFGRIGGDSELILPEKDKINSISEISIESLVKDDEKIEFLGGISGLSSGYIKDSINNGKVGYLHTSYKVGGISGASNGLVSGNINNASVYGRKDVAGIVGILEPYMEIAYKSDAIDKINRQMEVLDKLLDDFSAQVDKSATNFETNVDSITASKDKLETDIKERKDYHTEKVDEFNEGLDDKKDDLDLVTGNVVGDISDISDNIGDMRNGANYSDIINDRNSRLQNTIAAIKNISEISKRMKEDLENKKDHADNVMSDFADLSDNINELYTKSKDLMDYLDSNREDLGNDLDDTYKQVDESRKELERQIDKARGDLRSSRQDIKVNIDSIKAELSDIRLTMQDGKQNFEEKLESDTLYYDISANPSKEYIYAKVVSSINNGIVEGDINTAGIVGRIGIDIGDGIINKNIDSKINKTGNTSFNFSSNVYALVEGNKNEGDIRGKNSYVAGIVARADYGAINANQNYANISSESGSYVGGIVAYTKNVVSNSYNFSELSGTDYVGGIAGVAKEVKNNISMSSISTKELGKKGSIAAFIEEDGSVSDNLYVDYGTGAIDNISLQKEANSISYEDLVKREDIPDEFKYMRVKYIVGDEIIKQINVAYGTSLDESEIPPVLQKEGYNTYWETKDISNIVKNLSIHLIEERWNKNISSESSQGIKPILLASAYFYDNTSIKVESIQKPNIKNIKEAYRYSIEPQNAINGEKIELRLLSEDKSYNKIALIEAGEIKEIDCKRVGSYLSFEVDKASGEFVLMKENGINWIYIFISVFVLLAISSILGLIIKRKYIKK